MKVVHMLNVADLAFMLAGVAVAVLMMVVRASDDRRRVEPANGPAGSGRDPGA